MKSFKLEIRVYDNNTRRWQVFLERISDDHMLRNWVSPNDGKDYFSKTWTGMQMPGDILDVYVACSGYGGSVRCVVLINDAKPGVNNTIIANFDDGAAAKKTFHI